MRKEHTVEGKVVHKLGTEFSNLQTFGNEKGETPFITVQSNNNGQGKVIINPEVIGLNISEFKKTFSGLDLLNKKRDYDNRFKETNIPFIDHHNGHSYNMVFDNLKTALTAGNIWGYENSKEAKFVSKEKAIAFAQFINSNIIKSALHFKEELPEISNIINNNFNKPGILQKNILKTKVEQYQNDINSTYTSSNKNTL